MKMTTSENYLCCDQIFKIFVSTRFAKGTKSYVESILISTYIINVSKLFFVLAGDNQSLKNNPATVEKQEKCKKKRPVVSVFAAFDHPQ